MIVIYPTILYVAKVDNIDISSITELLEKLHNYDGDHDLTVSIISDLKKILDYSENKELSFDEKISLLGNMRLDKTKFGESAYQTKKLVIPCKGKNFSLKIYGMSSDYLSIESFGFVFKLGKVKED